MDIANTETIRLNISTVSTNDSPTLRLNNANQKELVLHSNTYLGVDDYNNLSNRPSINGVVLSGDRTIHEGLVDDVKVNGTSVVSNRVANIDVPTKTSDLTNDSGFITADYHDSTKQDVITDLSTIRSNATKGGQAKDTIDTYGDVVTHNTNEFATNSQGNKADSALQPDDVINNVTSTYTTSPLSANMGKELQDQVNNLKNIGRFLSIWNATTGTPSTEPIESPYTFKVGDYYRVGTAGTRNPAPNSTYTTGGTNWVEGSALSVGSVIYVSNISGDTSTWVVQAAGGGGTVQDVQINNATIIASGTGIANINVGDGLSFNTSTNTLAATQIIQVRNID